MGPVKVCKQNSNLFLSSLTRVTSVKSVLRWSDLLLTHPGSIASHEAKKQILVKKKLDKIIAKEGVYVYL